jgi:hypothetical protein
MLQRNEQKFLLLFSKRSASSLIRTPLHSRPTTQAGEFGIYMRALNANGSGISVPDPLVTGVMGLTESGMCRTPGGSRIVCQAVAAAIAVTAGDGQSGDGH